MADYFLLAKRTNVSYIKGMGITDRQKEISGFHRSFPGSGRVSPFHKRDLQGPRVDFTGSLIKHLRGLENEGFLTSIPGKKRAWKLTHQRLPFSVPLVGQIAAGTPILAEENREDDLPVDPKLFGSEDAFALRVRGDSMIGAQIRDGDLAVIRPQEDAGNGEIVAVLVEGLEAEATLKILRRSKKKLELQAANPAYEPLIFKGGDMAKVKILGKLIGIIRPAP